MWRRSGQCWGNDREERHAAQTTWGGTWAGNQSHPVNKETNKKTIGREPTWVKDHTWPRADSG